MDLQEYNLGYVQRGQYIEVELSNSAIVRIMNHHNYREFQYSKDHEFIGGYIRNKTYKAMVPYSDQWYVVVDLGGYSSQIVSKARVLTDVMEK